MIFVAEFAAYFQGIGYVIYALWILTRNGVDVEERDTTTCLQK